MLWQIKSQIPKDLKQSERFGAILETLYANRELTDPKARELFFVSKLPPLGEILKALPDLNIDHLKMAGDRITKAIKDAQPIIIYGDYDCDGVCSTAILWETLHSLGASAMPFIPHRLDHGYGLSEKGIADALKLFPDVKPLIITVDNGIRANAIAGQLKEQGIDLIITDHHVPCESLPEAVAIVHTIHLCGAGVAWLLSSSLKENVPTDLSTVSADLVALATVCDQLPLTNINRLLVKSGLESLRYTTRPGLISLYAISGITDPTTLETYHLGFVIGPRINAAGRLGHAIEALRLLATKNVVKATEYADRLQDLNSDRQELTQNFADEAVRYFRNLSELPKLLFYTKDDCPEGILGLISSRLTETFARPSIVLSTGGDKIKGSARSVKGVNITEVLNQASEFLVDFGGHELAAGLTTDKERLNALSAKLETLSLPFDESLLQKFLSVELELLATDISNELLDILKKFSPFGMGNTQPLFAAKFNSWDSRPVGVTGQHLKLHLIDGATSLDAIGFNQAKEAIDIAVGSPIDVVFSIEENNFRGKTTLQLNVRAIRSSLP